ncbi:MAG: hypothetical protein BMS9Abin20_0341 [Acidimicrobiia bacterium]|nr:MAG: hypothetical protein BMS9Abin20_0341 [Acidimicrobiia bacterium]
MTRRRSIATMTMLGAMTVFTVTALASPASAVVLEGPCTGSVTFEDGVNVTTFGTPNRVTESHPLSPTITIPADATVTYEGNMNIAPPDELVDFAGGVDIKIPLIGGVTIVRWPDPVGQTEMVADSGSYTYSLPSYVPKGTGGLELTARHTQMGTTCTVALNVAIAGESSVTGIITGALTALFGTLMVAAGIKKKVS